MATDLVLEPLASQEMLSTLREFQNLLTSCIGPQAGIKLLVSAVGYNTATSASRRLLDNISLNNPVCIYISQVMRHCSDHALYMGVMTTSLLENSLRAPFKSVRSIVQVLFNKLLILFDSPSIKLKIDFGTVQQLLPLARSVLATKPACGLTVAETEALNICTVKAFLQTLGDTMGQVLVECKGGSVIPPKVYRGVLYHIGLDESIPKMVTHKFTGARCFSLLLFTVMLTDEPETEQIKSGRVKLDPETWNTCRRVEEAQKLLEKAAELGVDIVACQKVVHPSLVLYLQRKGILLLQRLGTELAQAVEMMSHATSVASTVVNDLSTMLGTVTAVRLVERDYVLLEQKDGKVATLLASCPNEEAASELKVELEADDFNCNIAELKSGVSFVQKALLSAAGLKGNQLVVDSVYGHGWLLERDKCFCGMVSRGNVTEQNGKWGQTVGTSIPSVTENSIIDLHQNKVRAFKLAMECYTNILDIGMVVYVSCDGKS